jgi:hypothetical protein
MTDLREQADMPDSTGALLGRNDPSNFRVSDWSGYVRAHQKVNRVRGKADRCAFGCAATIYYWANLTGDYFNPENYAPMCSSCHHLFDQAIESMKGYARFPGGRPGKLTADLVRECRARFANGVSMNQLSDDTGVNYFTLWDAVRRKSWKWVA